MQDKRGNCELCGRQRSLTFHHLIPKSCHSNKWFKKHFTMEEMRGRGIDVCRQCHNFIHASYTEKVLGRDFNTIDKLRQSEALMKFVGWIRKQR